MWICEANVKVNGFYFAEYTQICRAIWIVEKNARGQSRRAVLFSFITETSNRRTNALAGTGAPNNALAPWVEMQMPTAIYSMTRSIVLQINKLSGWKQTNQRPQQATHSNATKHRHHNQPFSPVIPALFELLRLVAADAFDQIFPWKHCCQHATPGFRRGGFPFCADRRVQPSHRSFICARHDCPAPPQATSPPGRMPSFNSLEGRSARPLPLGFRLLILATMNVPSSLCPAALTVLALPMAAAILRAGVINADGSAPEWLASIAKPTLPAFLLLRQLPRSGQHSSHV